MAHLNKSMCFGERRFWCGFILGVRQKERDMKKEG